MLSEWSLLPDRGRRSPVDPLGTLGAFVDLDDIDGLARPRPGWSSHDVDLQQLRGNARRARVGPVSWTASTD
jgi:hypothetical protein